MNANLFLKSLKEIRISWPSYGLGMVVYIWLLLSIYPAFIERAEDFERLLENYPPEFLQFFGGDAASLTRVEGYLALEIFSLMWFFIIGAFVIAYGSGAIGKELDSGTIEILLGQPISRTAAIVSKSLVLYLGTAGLISLTMGATYLFGSIYGALPKTEGIVALLIVATLFFFAIGSLSLFFSVLFGERGKAALTVSGLLIAMYLLTSLGKNAEWAQGLDVISLFHYYNAEKLLSTGDIALNSILVFGGVFLIFFVGAILIFNQRNIAP